jgi:hypothetical protein
MPDFGQYPEETVYARLREACKYDGKSRLCVRCGKTTRAGLIFGAAICKKCFGNERKK